MLSGYNSFLDSRLLKIRSSGQFCFNSSATSVLIAGFYFFLLVWHTSLGAYPAEKNLVCTYIINSSENQQFELNIVNEYFYVCI